MQYTAFMTGIPRTQEQNFELVVRAREAQVLRTAYRILGNYADAEDVAQETLVRLYRHGLDFPNEAALGSWLYRVTVNLCFDRTRSSKSSQQLPERLPGVEASAERDLLRAERKQRLMLALEQLGTKERAAVVLREIEGLPTAEVAEILGSSEGTVRSQISKALVRLREILGEGSGGQR
jgi:RNA polymerase sigma-70 factor (ECF subfamily)